VLRIVSISDLEHELALFEGVLDLLGLGKMVKRADGFVGV
jgi:hypothetical protein